MNAYKIKGTSRAIGAIGAIGASEPFERIILAESARHAYEENRRHFYDVLGREMLHTMEIQESKVTRITENGIIGDNFVTVDPDQYQPSILL